MYVHFIYMTFSDHGTGNFKTEKIKDGWGVTHERGTKVVKGYYFEKINNNILNYRLVKSVIAYVPFLSVKPILLVDIYTDLLQLTENDHLDILCAIDLREN